MGSKTPSRVRIPQSPPDFIVKKLTESPLILHNSASAPVAQLDRAPGYELGGRRFESFRARQTGKPAITRRLFCFLARARRHGQVPARRNSPVDNLHAAPRRCNHSPGGTRYA